MQCYHSEQVIKHLHLSTKSGQEIHFSCVKHVQTSVQIPYEKVIIKAVVNGQDAGYAKLSYINKSWADEHLKTPIDYFMMKTYEADNLIAQAYQDKNILTLVAKFAQEINLGSDKVAQLTSEKAYEYWNKIETSFNAKHYHKFTQFKEYWLNKPTLEMICVFSDKDNHGWDFSELPAQKTPRDNVNFRGQHVGLALYQACIAWCVENKMELWVSDTQTTDAKKMWSILEQIPGLTLIKTTVEKYSSTGELLSTTFRRCLKPSQMYRPIKMEP